MGRMRNLAIATAMALTTASIGMIAQAVQLADGTTYFEAVPQLEDASITRQSVSDSNVKYYFDVSIPGDAGEPLQRLEINQQHGDLFTREVDFVLEESRAFEGRRRDRGSELGISDVHFNEDTNTVMVTFNPAIEPGTDFTLQLKAKRNPLRAGVYLFGVTAYPIGEVAHGQFLGFGRFHIYDNDGNVFR